MAVPRQIVTQGIVLKRTNFGEADRIITMLTPDQGKLRLMAKGVRKIKSKLAGGIELFSISQITFIPGKKDIATLISTRLKTNYGNIAKDLNQTMLGYELIKRVDRATEDAPEAEYFELLQTGLVALDAGMPTDLLELWFDARLLALAGHQPNLVTDNRGQRLQADQQYNFDFENMAMSPSERGRISSADIKFLRLVFGISDPQQLQQIKDANKVLSQSAQLVATMRKQHIRT